MTEGTSQRVPMSQRGIEKSIDTPSKKVIPPKDPEFKIRPSLLSTEASSHSYRGFLNLTVILLIITNFRLIVENIMKYGWMVELEPLTVREWYRWHGTTIVLSMSIYILIAFLLEKAASKKLVTDRVVSLLQTLNIISLVVISSAAVLFYRPPAAAGIIAMLTMTISMMKLISYVQVNKHLRQDSRKPGSTSEKTEGEVTYPHNLTVADMAYFIIAPTLVYDMNFPRAEKIRWGFLARRIIETFTLSALIFGICEQYILPLIRNSILPMEQQNLLHITERLLKLSIPNLLVWLIGFYVFFHLYLNLLAEITRFGDREFYKDWWNSTDLGYFWRTWNMPVHHWILKHVYSPSVRAGLHINTAKFLAFMVSAVFHEVVISFPFATLKGWAFFGILSQLPLITLTNKYCKGKNIGNVVFWFSIVLGQPFLVLLYYRDYVKNSL